MPRGKKKGSNMKIGVQSAPVMDQLGVDQGFQLLKECGFSTVDYNIDHELPYGDIVNGRRTGIFYKSEREVVEFFAPIREAADRHGMGIHQVHAPFPCYVKDAAAQEDLMQALSMSIAAAHVLGAPHVIIHPAFLAYQEGLTPQQEWEMNKALYLGLAPALRKYKVTCCLENMFTAHRGHLLASVCGDPHEAVHYLDELNNLAQDRLYAFCLDTGHALLSALDTARYVRILGDRLEALHVHDNDGQHDQHLNPYMGILDWEPFCRALGDIGYKGVLSFETFNTLATFPQQLWGECLQLLSATGRLFAEWVNDARTNTP